MMKLQYTFTPKQVVVALISFSMLQVNCGKSLGVVEIEGLPLEEIFYVVLGLFGCTEYDQLWYNWM